MKKIPTLFVRDRITGRVIDEVQPGCEWVFAGEGVATRKYDGTCCLIRGGKLFKRYDAKHGKTPPTGFEPAQDPDPVTGHWPGWLAVGDGPEDRWHREAFKGCEFLPEGTYELIGPKIQSNPEDCPVHMLTPHGKNLLLVPLNFNGIREHLAENDIEGIVWHHPDGRMAKIKGKDFGIRRMK